LNLFTLIILFIAFTALIIYLGFLGRKKTRTLQDFLVAGREMPYYVMAISYSAAFISTSIIVGFGGVSGILGLNTLWLAVLSIIFGILVSFVFLGKRTRRLSLNLEAYTFPEILGKRYDSIFIQKISSIVIIIAMPIYAAVVLIGAARFVESFLKVEYLWALIIISVIVVAYVLVGGLKGIMYTDSFFGAIMVFSMIVLIFLTYKNFGGVIASHESLTELTRVEQPLRNQFDHHVPFFSKIPLILKQVGHQGWTAMPVPGSQLWWTLMTTIIFGIGVGILAQPQLIIRFMTVKNDKDINRAVPIGAGIIFFTMFASLVVGALSNIYFFNKTGDVSVISLGGNADLIIPSFIEQALPKWFGYLFMFTILSAAMSTISSQFHIVGTAFSKDILGKNLIKADDKINNTFSSRGIILTKIGIIAGFIISVILAYYLPLNIIARGTALFFNICTSTFLAIFILGLYWKRVTRAGAISGLVTGLVSSLFWILFIQKAQWYRPNEISRVMIGTEGLLGFPWDTVDSVLVALPLSFIATIAVSVFTRKLPDDIIKKCFQ